MTTYADATKAVNDLIAAFESNPRANHIDEILRVADISEEAFLSFEGNLKAGLDSRENEQAYEAAQDKIDTIIRKIAGISAQPGQ